MSIVRNVIEVSDGESKADYINSSKCVFIDDSFRERSSMRAVDGVFVFDVYEAENLIL